jgi:hypothetical protein
VLGAGPADEEGSRVVPAVASRYGVTSRQYEYTPAAGVQTHAAPT